MYEEYELKRVKDLKVLCKDRKLTGYSSLTKPELIKVLLEHDAAVKIMAPEPGAKVEVAPIAEAIPAIKGRSVGATTMAAAQQVDPAIAKHIARKGRNKLKARRRAIRKAGGVSGWA